MACATVGAVEALALTVKTAQFQDGATETVAPSVATQPGRCNYAAHIYSPLRTAGRRARAQGHIPHSVPGYSRKPPEARSVKHRVGGLFVSRHPPWRQPRGKWKVSLVNSHTNITSKRWHLCEMDLRFAFDYGGVPRNGTAGRKGRGSSSLGFYASFTCGLFLKPL